jgi:pimeloyl-ACP methyl ester carboxylesterase
MIGKQLFHYSLDSGRLLKSWALIPSQVAGGLPVRIHARYRNDAFNTLPPIVLVHGCAAGSSYMVPLAAQLATEANVYVPELPGHGRSDKDARPLKVMEMARALADWMDQMELRAALLAGQSLGCQIAAVLVAKNPQLAIGLVLISPMTDPSLTTSDQIKRAITTAWADKHSLAALTAVEFARSGPEIVKTELRELAERRLEYMLPNVDVPVRVIRGENDSLVPQSWAERVSQLAGAEPPIVVPGCGHAVQYDDPITTARLIIPFARNLRHSSTEEPKSEPMLPEETVRN